MTPDVQQEILDQIAKGKSLVKILLSDKGRYPTYSGFMDWMAINKEFSDKYAKAKADQADYLAEELMDIADEADASNVNVARLRVDTRKWIASKLKPKKYGERLGLENADETRPFTIVIKKRDE